MNREHRKAVIGSHVEAFLDALEEDFPDDDDEIGVVCIVIEMAYEDVDGDRRTSLPYYCSDERKFVQHGIFSLVSQVAAEGDPEPDDPDA